MKLEELLQPRCVKPSRKKHFNFASNEGREKGEGVKSKKFNGPKILEICPKCCLGVGGEKFIPNLDNIQS